MYLSVLLLVLLHYGSLQSSSTGSFPSRFENKLFADSPLTTDLEQNWNESPILALFCVEFPQWLLLL